MTMRGAKIQPAAPAGGVPLALRTWRILTAPKSSVVAACQDAASRVLRPSSCSLNRWSFSPEKSATMFVQSSRPRLSSDVATKTTGPFVRHRRPLSLIHI